MSIQRAAAWAALVLLFITGPTASGQAGEPDGILQDGEGDVQMVGPIGEQTPPVDAGRDVDLVGLDVTEDPDAFQFLLDLMDLRSSEESDDLGATHWIHFAHEDAKFRIELQGSLTLGGEPLFSVNFQRYEPGADRYEHVDMWIADVDVGAATIASRVPRELLTTANGTAPRPGSTLDGLWVLSEGNRLVRGFTYNGVYADTPYFTDRMPDQGEGGPFEVQLGVRQTGHAHLASEEPFRASNGEATTYVFDVAATNRGDAPDTFELNASDVPDSWSVELPTPVVTIGNNTTAKVPVIVRTAFNHQHGGVDRFLLALRSASDPESVGRLEMGVRYLWPPQPAGHHDTVWFHSIDHEQTVADTAWGAALDALGEGGALQEPYMNALQDDPRADEVPIPGSFCRVELLDDDYPAGSGYCWDLPLSPELALGLDFALEREGELSATISTMVPMPASSIEGTIHYLEPSDGDQRFGDQRERVPIATIARSELQDIGAGGSATFTTNVTPLPEADWIPYERGAGLVLELRVLTLRPENFYLGPKEEPQLEPGGVLRLPLNEYEDPVKDVYSFGGAVTAVVRGPQQKPVNPGETVTFQVEMRNGGAERDTFSLRLVGSHIEWAHLLEPRPVTLDPGEKRVVTIAVNAPDDAVHGDRADLVLEVSSGSDLDVRSLVRILAVIDAETDHPDEAEFARSIEEREAKESPPVSWALLAVTMTGAALLRSRR